MKKKRQKAGIFLFLLLFVISTAIVFNYYKRIFSSAVNIEAGERFIYVNTSSTLNSLINQLYNESILKDTASFRWVAEKKSFKTPSPGRYLIKSGMSNNELINAFRSGAQLPIKLTLNSVRTKFELAKNVSKVLELDSIDLITLLNDADFTVKYGFNLNTIPCLFIPNTYEFYWNTSAEEFLSRMASEYKKFWDNDKLSKARAMNLSQSEVCILASIVQAEQMAHRDERSKVAGLYVNRIKRGMRLQSDPTLIYALGDFSIRRVLNEHKELSSPYNTYKYSGLPPGPINIPERSSIESVLNYEKHNYLYMCAKADFSGYHNFARSLQQHNVYANQYRRELNRRKIMR